MMSDRTGVMFYFIEAVLLCATTWTSPLTPSDVNYEVFRLPACATDRRLPRTLCRQTSRWGRICCGYGACAVPKPETVQNVAFLCRWCIRSCCTVDLDQNKKTFLFSANPNRMQVSEEEDLSLDQLYSCKKRFYLSEAVMFFQLAKIILW